MCGCLYFIVCVTKVALQSAVQQTPLPTHGFTPPHSDTLMSHMLYSNTFVLTSVFLGHTVSYLSCTLNPSYTIFFLYIHIFFNLSTVRLKFPEMLITKFSSLHFTSWLWTLGSWWALQQPLYVNSAVIRPECDISKIVRMHSHQMAATQ